jgi:hypothetical protein
MASIIGLLGLPMTVGSRLPCSAKTRGAESEPEPTKVVPFVGKVLSWFVRRKWTEGSSRRYE